MGGPRLGPGAVGSRGRAPAGGSIMDGGGHPPSDAGPARGALGQGNVELPVRLGRGDGAFTRRIDGFLSFLGLDALADRTPNEVSIGEQQRTALARALVLGPTLLLADEPTGHQDEGWAKAVFRLLHMVARRGTTCLIGTPNEEAVRIADRALAIRDGVVDATSRRDQSRSPAEA